MGIGIFGVSMSVIDRFEEWCRSRGGVAEEKYAAEGEHYSCVFPNYLKAEDVDEFADFIAKNIRELRKDEYHLCVEHENRFIGDYGEEESVCYLSLIDEFWVETSDFSDTSVSGKVKKRLMEKRFPRYYLHRKTVVDSHTVTFDELMRAVFNKATNEWLGWGKVRAELPYGIVQENPDIVAKVFDKAREEASYCANEALSYIKGYVKPAKERFTFLTRALRFMR